MGEHEDDSTVVDSAVDDSTVVVLKSVGLLI